MNAILDKLYHRYLKVPYPLHVTVFQAPKKPRATYVLLHGIAHSAKAWDKVVPLLPKNVRVIGIDLLGFGQSPKPNWIKYDAKTQARSVGYTLLKLRLSQRPVLVGHSLGGLVSIEIAKRYPLYIRRLILCSPPFYEPTAEKRRLLKRDEILKDIYKRMLKYPQTLDSLMPLITRLKLASPAFDLHTKSAAVYVEALESSIINQTSLHDAYQLKLPTTILYGTLDPVVISSHIRKLAKARPNVTAKKIITGHEIVGRYTTFVAKEISDGS